MGLMELLQGQDGVRPPCYCMPGGSMPPGMPSHHLLHAAFGHFFHHFFHLQVLFQAGG